MNLDIPFGEWLPDLPDLSNPGATEAKNVLPHQGSYLPFRQLSVTSSALGAACQGAAAFSDKDGNTEAYAGDVSKLYRLSSQTWADKSGTTYSTASTGFWRFVKWGEKVIATNGAQPPQIKSFGAGGNFADLGGSPPKAKSIATVRSFVVLGDVDDGTRYPNRVQWSGQNLETSWGTVPSTQADYQTLEGDGGAIQAITGGDVGLIVQERSIWEMRYEGPPIIFRFDETAPGIGTPAPRSVVRFGTTTFFWGNDGFYRYDIGRGPTRIGDKKVDLWFQENLNKDALDKVVAAIDIPNAKVVWSFPFGSTADNLIIYDWTTGQWSRAEQDTEMIFSGRSPGTDLEGLDSISSDIDALTQSLDSDQWKGGALSLWGFDTTHKSGSFSGSALTATLETAEVGNPDSSMIYVNGIRPLVDGDGASNRVYVGTRDVQNNNYSYGNSIFPNSIGEHNTRAAARYFRFRVDISGGFERAIGMRARAKSNGIR